MAVPAFNVYFCMCLLIIIIIASPHLSLSLPFAPASAYVEHNIRFFFSVWRAHEAHALLIICLSFYRSALSLAVLCSLPVLCNTEFKNVYTFRSPIIIHSIRQSAHISTTEPEPTKSASEIDSEKESDYILLHVETEFVRLKLLPSSFAIHACIIPGLTVHTLAVCYVWAPGTMYHSLDFANYTQYYYKSHKSFDWRTVDFAH